jgi:hypothetical protein
MGEVDRAGPATDLGRSAKEDARVDIATEEGPLGPADEARVQRVLAQEGFSEFVVLSRGEAEFLRAGHW